MRIVQTTLKCYGHLEQRSGLNTTWEGTTLFEPMPSIYDWVLPANGIYTRARYYLTLTLSDVPMQQTWDIGTYTSRAVGKGSFSDDFLEVTVDSKTDTGDTYVSALFGTIFDVVDWEEFADTDLWVEMSFEYDPGLSRTRNGFTQDTLVENERASTYKTQTEILPFPRSELPSPDPTTSTQGLEREFPELGLTLDYTGRITGGDAELRLPMGVHHGFAQDDVLVLLLMPGLGDVAEPTVELPERQTIVGVDAAGRLDWTLDTAGYELDGLLWGPVVVDETLLMTAARNRTAFSIDTETGQLTDAIELY